MISAAASCTLQVVPQFGQTVEVAVIVAVAMCGVCCRAIALSSVLSRLVLVATGYVQHSLAEGVARFAVSCARHERTSESSLESMLYGVE